MTATEPTRDSQATLRQLGLRRGGTWLFRGLDLVLPRGKFIAVVGPSGAGKSSLLACLSGMLPPTEGTITYACQNGCTHEVPDFQPRVGIVFQNYMLIENSTLLSNVLCGRLGRYSWWRTLFGFPSTEQREAYRLLDEVGLARYVHRRVAEVSGGEQQRTAVARALFQEPEIFLADEPVSNLDTALTERVLGILKRQAVEEQRTVVCVLHSPELVERYADLVLSIEPGDPATWSLRAVERSQMPGLS